MHPSIPRIFPSGQAMQIIPQYHRNNALFGSWINNYHHIKNHAIACHWHEDLEFHLVLEGHIQLNLSGTLLKLQAGDCVFVNRDTLHMSHQERDCHASSFVLSFHPQLFYHTLGQELYDEYLESFLEHTNGFLIDQSLPCGFRIRELLQEYSSLDCTESGYELRCLEKLFSIWHETMQYRKKTLQPDHTPRLQKNNSIAVKQMLAYIYSHFDQPLEIEHLMEASSLSRSECFRCFQRYIGIPPMEYVNDYRLAQSAILLTDTDMGILDICLACGFSSSSYYGKLFKRRYGVSPLAYRKSAAASVGGHASALYT